MKSRLAYCNLNRQFARFARKSDFEDFAVESYTGSFSLWGATTFGWSELSREGGFSIVLGEPGSGRTMEFKGQCEKLNTSGQVAFYLQLHQLVDANPEEYLEKIEREAFTRWKESEIVATFFLDAVDEAKLERHSDFEIALKRFARACEDSLARARIFISSRISEWSPETDLRLVFDVLSACIPPGSHVDGDESPSKEEVLPVFVINPLERDQVREYASFLDVPDPANFIRALDQNHAWEFARRPLDVQLISNYWKSKHRIGSLAEMLEYQAENLLQEVPDKGDRSRKRPLSPEDARNGAECLAAASILCKKLDFEIPDFAPAHKRKGIQPLECLPSDWNQAQGMTLLDRPLFDAAIYGRVRFHHRRLAEYLAACWMKRRMDNQCPTQVMFDLFFAKIGEDEILKPSRAPMAVWLACLADDGWSKDLRLKILRSAPQAFFRFGDPSRLPVSLRASVVDAFVERFKSRGLLRIETENGALSRLADPALGESAARHIADPSLGDGVREELLDLAIHGKIIACVPAALRLLAHARSSRSLQNHAIWLIQNVGDDSHKRELAEIAKNHTEFSEEHLGVLCQALFPQYLNEEEFGKLILRAGKIGQGWTDAWHIVEAFKRTEENWSALKMLEILMAGLGDDGNADSSNPGLLKSRCKLMRPLLKSVLLYATIPPEKAELVGRALFFLRGDWDGREYLDSEHDDGEPKVADLDKATANFPTVRRFAFRHALQHELGKRGDDNVGRSGRMAFSYIMRFTPKESDMLWLFDEIEAPISGGWQLACARLAFEHWVALGRNSHYKRLLLRALEGNLILRREILNTIRRHNVSRYYGWWHALRRKKIFSRYYWMEKKRMLRGFAFDIRDRWNLHTRIHHLRSGRNCHWIVLLTRCCSPSSQWTVKDWRKLESKYGPRIAKATQEGCINVWKSYEPAPTRASGNVPNGLIAGLCGLGLLYKTKRLDFQNLSASDARRAALYAVNEMNGYPEWFPELSKYHPEAVGAVLAECIRREWQTAESKEFWPRNLQELARINSPVSSLAPLVGKTIMELLQSQACPHPGVLSHGLTILTNLGEQIDFDFRALAAINLGASEVDSETYDVWLAVCLQTNPEVGLKHLEARAAAEPHLPVSRSRDNVMVRLCAGLSGRRERFPKLKNSQLLSMPHLGRFFRLAARLVLYSQDFPRPSGEAYSPTARDEAQSYREFLLAKIAEDSHPEAERLLLELANEESMSSSRDWILHLLDQRAERMADASKFEPDDVRQFLIQNESRPRVGRELFQLCLRRLDAIKHDVERAEVSIRPGVREGDHEVDLRRFLALELSRRKCGLYTVTQEPVIQNEERLDIRVETPEVIGPVILEVKLANMSSRTTDSLLRDLENQLVQRYLKDQAARFGIYVLGVAAERKGGWKDHASGVYLTFQELTAALKVKAAQLREQYPEVEELEVIGIDFRG